ncbi:hypothetical protein ACC736_38240, partial [Rhizobium ruizarguesonis]
LVQISRVLLVSLIVALLPILLVPGNEGALLRIGEYNGASYEGLDYKFIDRNEEDWKEGDYQAYKQYSRDLNQ